jgi:hypothetical protein
MEKGSLQSNPQTIGFLSQVLFSIGLAKWEGIIAVYLLGIMVRSYFVVPKCYFFTNLILTCLETDKVYIKTTKFK